MEFAAHVGPFFLRLRILAALFHSLERSIVLFCVIEPRRIPALFLVLWAFSQSLPTVRSEIRIEENRLGNLFLTNETIQIPLSSDGTEIGWKVTDYFGHLVAQGRERLSNNHAVIQPDISQVGYFDLQLTEHEGSEVTSSLSTSFAILTPVDIRTMAHSPFGVMTHFA
ncbi:MAG TPA: hypothetical protein VIS99_15345, partial [Terrimicrobiaceae bacterium]